MIGLRRITSTIAYIPEIDGIRFVAILLVVLYHINGSVLRYSPFPGPAASSFIYWLAIRGNFGVSMFFVVSGFVLALPFARKWLAGGAAPSVAQYYLRRVTRLEPPYVLALLIFFVLKVAGGRGTVGSLAPHLLASILYQHNLIYSRPSSIDFVAWTLEIEVQFYLLAPIIAALLFRTRNVSSRRTVILVTILVSAYVARTLSPLSERFELSLLCHLQYFLAGFLLADLYVLHDARANAWKWDFVALLGLVAPFLCMRANLALDYFAPLALMAGYYGIMQGVMIRRLFSVNAITIIGGMCYSIYLIHNYVIAASGLVIGSIAHGLPYGPRFGVQAALLLPIVLATSTLFFVSVERPCMIPEWPLRLRERLWRRSDSGLDRAPSARSEKLATQNS